MGALRTELRAEGIPDTVQVMSVETAANKSACVGTVAKGDAELIVEKALSCLRGTNMCSYVLYFKGSQLRAAVQTYVQCFTEGVRTSRTAM